MQSEKSKPTVVAIMQKLLVILNSKRNYSSKEKDHFKNIKKIINTIDYSYRVKKYLHYTLLEKAFITITPKTIIDIPIIPGKSKACL